MTMKMESLSRKNSAVMEIPSVVNSNGDVVTQRMDITMILNPSDTKVGTEDHPDGDSVDSKMDIDIKHEPSQGIQQPIPVLGELSSLIQDLEIQNRARLSATRSGRTQLPQAPIHSRPLTFNPINAHGSYHLPPIHCLHAEGYHSPPSAHHHSHHRGRRHHPHHSRYSQSAPTPNKKKPRSNKAYSIEEVDFIRYHKDDLRKHWPEILSLFRQYFRQRQRDSEQCLSSRYYRDNCCKMYDANGRPMRDDNGKIRVISCKVRSRGTPAGREEALPFTLVQKHPSRAMRYPWVSEQHKVEARRLAEEMTDQERGMCFPWFIQFIHLYMYCFTDSWQS